MGENYFTTELNRLKTSVLKMGGMVEEILDDALKALFDEDLILAQKVIEGDLKVNAQEVFITNYTVLLMATNQPVATDLRRLVSTLRMVAELERVGDISANIGRATKRLIGIEHKESLPKDIPIMGKMAQEMLKLVLDAIARNSVEMAENVLSRDDELDSLEHKVREDIICTMEKENKLVRWGLDIIKISGYLERLGDHSTNLAEEVIFIAKGKNVRHIEKI